MIERYVILTIKKENRNDFMQIFYHSRELICSFDGCQHVELLQSASDDSKFMTFSIWKSELHLESYRTSALFSQIWKQVKPFFRDRAEALSIFPDNEKDGLKKQIFLAKFEK